MDFIGLFLRGYEMSEEKIRDTQESRFIEALRAHEEKCKERHQEVRQDFRDVRQDIKDVMASIRSNLTITLIAIGVGMAILGYLSNKPSPQLAQASQPQIIFLDVQSILEQRKAGFPE
ncbi:MAG: hypothetical protein OXF09_02800 [Hyphomicrobiales bacterium]|nr:hypothetical protein [Hyphomicrobiales bacterium]